MSLSVVSCCCEGDMCPEEAPMMTSAANDSSAPPTSTSSPETETVEPNTTETDTGPDHHVGFEQQLVGTKLGHRSRDHRCDRHGRRDV